MTLALDPLTQTFWWVTLGIGAVVAVVVVILLQFLLLAVVKIEGNVKVLWQTATTVARNTATSWMLGNTADGLEELKTEALRHDAFLSEALQSQVGGAAVSQRGAHS